METQPQSDSNAAFRRAIYGILICVGMGGVIGRILAVDSVDLRMAADGKFEKELAEKRAELDYQGVSAIEIDYALLQERTRLAVMSGAWRPFQSPNDRSRWCTVRALVEPEMQVPDAPYAIDKVIQQPGWDTIDMIRRNGHFYSSKPPLFVTLMAGEYWVREQADNRVTTEGEQAKRVNMAGS